MTGCYEVDLVIQRLEEGGWSIEVPDLQGCRVEAPRLEAGLAEIQDASAVTYGELKRRVRNSLKNRCVTTYPLSC